MEPLPRVVTVKEAMKILRCNRHAITKMIRDKRLHAIRLSKDYRIAMSSIEKLLREGEGAGGESREAA